MSNRITAREGAKKVAIVNGGTIPDRGLFGVFLAGATRGARVGELDEEMVFESRTGDTIILGASTWRIEEITHDRVIVSPAPGEPGKMPFWHGDTAGRPSEFGQKIGEMTRELLQLPRPVAYTQLVEDHSLDANAAENLLRYLEDQAAAAGVVPNDQEILIERCRDELGDWRVCVLTPFGSRVHAPWCMAVTCAPASRTRYGRGNDVVGRWFRDPAAGFRGDARHGNAAAFGSAVAGSGARNNWAAHRCSRRSSARPRLARCCCRNAGRSSRAALAAAKARRGPAGRRLALFLVSDPA